MLWTSCGLTNRSRVGNYTALTGPTPAQSCTLPATCQSQHVNHNTSTSWDARSHVTLLRHAGHACAPTARPARTPAAHSIHFAPTCSPTPEKEKRKGGLSVTEGPAGATAPQQRCLAGPVRGRVRTVQARECRSCGHLAFAGGPHGTWDLTLLSARVHLLQCMHAPNLTLPSRGGPSQPPTPRHD